ncbi:DUF4099 domain-containing protein [Dysgonomonas sp. ZJ709]|uniref:DUF4099 domain-containing protein n=1 Tax=Dysgonomonas sp. ZJ709 TaxID=2709797 RepID=UPI0013ECE711|nr:DUF4099 domain-containing protein [Dysgonomonas sp. ZJ709]
MNTDKKHMHDESSINWEELAGIGIYRDELEKSGEIDRLLDGEKTNPINLRLMLLGIDLDLDATLQIILQGEQPVIEIVGISTDTPTIN